ncbi:MAG: glycosyltransferase [Actinomycetota bacterium]|nr:glycosyltransferase [Actinomycetota bacterium]
MNSHFAAHAATVRFDGPSIVYYQTPARLLWRPDLELARLPERVQPLAKAALPALRAYDRWVAQHPTVMVANSQAVAKRIQKAYGRDAEVVHPGVDVERWASVERREPRHVLWFGRLVAYKRPELAIEAARAAGLPIVLVGDGPERPRLEALAYEGATFLGHADESVVRAALSEAIALIHPGEEDFGMTAVEAQAAGVPVVALDAGGACETVLDDRTGFLVRGDDPTDFGQALKEAERRAWDRGELGASAKRFDASVFRKNMAALEARTFGAARGFDH